MSLTRRIEAALLFLLPARWRTRALNASSENRAILRGAGWVTIFLLGAKLIAAFKEILVAKYYGTGFLIDGYLFAFNVASWPLGVISHVAIFVLVPLLVRMQAEAPQDMPRFKTELLTASLGIGFLLAMVIYGLLPIVIQSDWIGMSSRTQVAALQTIPFVAAMVFFGIVAAMYSTWLMSRQRHANTFLEGIPALVVAAILLLWPWDSVALTLTPLLWGTVIGFMLQASWLAILTRGYVGMQVIAMPRRSPHWRAVYNAFSVLLLAQFIMSTTALVDQFLLARLPEGSLAAFGYAQRVMALVLGLSATVLGRAMLPVFASVADAGASWKLARYWIWRVFWIGFAGAAALVLLGKAVVELLFERGAFTPDDTQAVTQILVVLALQLPSYLAGTVWLQWLLSRHGAASPLVIAAVVSSTIKIGMAFVLVVVLDMGVIALAYTYVVFSVFYLVVLELWHMVNKKAYA